MHAVLVESPSLWTRQGEPETVLQVGANDATYAMVTAVCLLLLFNHCTNRPAVGRGTSSRNSI